MDLHHAEHPRLVGLGLVNRGDAYLVRRRPLITGSPMPGLWEFPGGKCEPGETPEQATARECLEEIGVAVQVGRLRHCLRYQYPHGYVELHYFDCRLDPSDAEPLPTSGFLWLPARDLLDLDFPPANAEVVAALAAMHSQPASGTIETPGRP